MAGTIGFTKIIGKQETAKGSNVLINACCPGWVRMDMTKGRGHKTPDKGAETLVMLALGDIDGKTGEFWQDKRIVQW
jgi:carbonyl reductase 1